MSAEHVQWQISCQVCGHPAAVRLSSGRALAYVSCDECGTQVYTRNRPASRLLEKKAGMVETAVPVPAEPDAAPAPAPAPVAKPRRADPVADWLSR